MNDVSQVSIALKAIDSSQMSLSSITDLLNTGLLYDDSESILELQTTYKNILEKMRYAISDAESAIVKIENSLNLKNVSNNDGRVL